jgi:hypothetical protein
MKGLIMTVRNLLRPLAVALLTLACIAGAAAAADPAPKADSYDLGAKFFKAQRYALAIRNLREFTAASVGDPRLPKAKDMLIKSWDARTKQLVDSHLLGEAAAAFADYVAFLGETDSAAQVQKGRL